MRSLADPRRSVVIVGGSIAAATATDALRAAGHEGSITVLSDEDLPPYRRPPLSKAVLTGVDTPDSVLLPALDSSVTLRCGAVAVSLDVERSRVVLANGEQVPYDAILLATGARARRLSSNPTEVVLRSVGDAVALREQLLIAEALLIVGGGFLGMEIASSARSLGVAVTVIDQDPHLVRQFGSALASHICRAAEAQGVELVRCSGGVDLLGDGQITAVRTAEGVVHEADLVISAVGCRPNVEWLGTASFADPGGVRVDEKCLVAPHIAAAGDLVAQVDADGRRRRTPHWGSALDQARTAATALVRGSDAPAYQARPYFWSDQFGFEMKIAGEITAGAILVEIEGSLVERDALLQWTLDGRPVAAGSINRRVPVPKLHKLASAEAHG